MKVVTLPEDLIQEGIKILTAQDAILCAIKAFYEELEKNKHKQRKFWRQVNQEAKDQGIVKAQNEVFTLDEVLEQVVVVSIVKE